MDRQQIGLKLTLDALDLPLRVDTFDNRMVIQKAIYLCQMAGVHLGYRYNWYLRGPYSRDLTRDAFELCAKQNSEPEEIAGSQLDAESIRKLNNLVPLLHKPTKDRPLWLELLASVLFLTRSYDGQGKNVAGLREILVRNDKHFSENEVREALEDLARHGLYSQPSI